MHTTLPPWAAAMFKQAAQVPKHRSYAARRRRETMNTNTDAVPMMWVVSGHLREICNGNTMNIYAAPEQDRFADFPLYGRASVDAAVAAERERCAKLVEDACAYTGGHGEPGTPSGDDLAKLIRKRPNTTVTGPDGSELSDWLGLAEEARVCARHCKEGAWSPNVLQNEQGVRMKSAQVLEAAAAEIERLHRLLKEPTRGRPF